MPSVTGAVINPIIMTNCTKCGNPAGSEVRGEDGTVATADLLVHSWHIIETDVDIFWDQLNPRDACTANPVKFGARLRAGQCTAFFVDHSLMDGVIAIQFCIGQTLPALCSADPTRPEGLVRVIRKDSILLPSITLDNISVMAPTGAPNGTC